jgi:hypothetical protein
VAVQAAKFFGDDFAAHNFAQILANRMFPLEAEEEEENATRTSLQHQLKRENEPHMMYMHADYIQEQRAVNAQVRCTHA